MVIAYELLHSLKMKTSGRSGVLALKLDMSKAYDRVEWKFLVAMMRRVGFGPKLVAVVLECISTPVFSIVINGKVGSVIKPGRGLRQGCPLSPYLFLLCAEGLSALIRGQERLGLWRGFSCSLGAPVITHLLFADDSLLFCRADPRCFAALRTILDTYEKGSGQLVNLEKSAFCCSRNIPEGETTIISGMIGIPYTREMKYYLGMPIRAGRQKL